MRAQKEQGQQSPLMHKLTSAGRGLLGALHRKAHRFHFRVRLCLWRFNELRVYWQQAAAAASAECVKQCQGSRWLHSKPGHAHQEAMNIA